jgi:hypothetical protein
MQRGKERSQWRTTKSNDFDLFVPFCHRSLLDRLVSYPKKSIEKGQAYMFYEMISGFICYALHRVCLLSFLHFRAMRFASLYKKRETFESEK